MPVDDPVTMLKNDHAVLLGQLGLLETRGEGELTAVLHALLRDCTVHFRRERLLFDALRSALGNSGKSLDSLVMEHRELEERIKRLIEEMQEGRGGETHRERIHELIGQFQTHIRHEETVVFVLAGTRLTAAQRQDIARHMLIV